jgi:hypothetical protein
MIATRNPPDVFNESPDGSTCSGKKEFGISEAFWHSLARLRKRVLP